MKIWFSVAEIFAKLCCAVFFGQHCTYLILTKGNETINLLSCYCHVSWRLANNKILSIFPHLIYCNKNILDITLDYMAVSKIVWRVCEHLIYIKYQYKYTTKLSYAFYCIYISDKMSHWWKVIIIVVMNTQKIWSWAYLFKSCEINQSWPKNIKGEFVLPNPIISKHACHYKNIKISKFWKLLQNFKQ